MQSRNFFLLYIFLGIILHSEAFAKGLIIRIDGSEILYGGMNERVYVDSFSIDKYEVTNAEYGSFPSEKGFRQNLFVKLKHLNEPMQPVAGIDWYDASSFCKWKGGRLPRDYEWFKAAFWDPVNKKVNIYPWGNIWDFNRLNTVENLNMKPSIVGLYPTGDSFYGVSDMGGNVWEWIEDNYSARQPMFKIVRGGSWGNKDNVSVASSIFKGGTNPKNRFSTIGFRCVY